MTGLRIVSLAEMIQNGIAIISWFGYDASRGYLNLCDLRAGRHSFGIRRSFNHRQSESVTRHSLSPELVHKSELPKSDFIKRVHTLKQIAHKQMRILLIAEYCTWDHTDTPSGEKKCATDAEDAGVRVSNCLRIIDLAAAKGGHMYLKNSESHSAHFPC